MNNLSPVWKTFKVSLNTLCSGDHDRELKVSLQVTETSFHSNLNGNNPSFMFVKKHLERPNGTWRPAGVSLSGVFLCAACK